MKGIRFLALARVRVSLSGEQLRSFLDYIDSFVSTFSVVEKERGRDCARVI